MYLDFDDRRPAVPRVQQALRMRSGVVLSLLVHAAGAAAIFLLPSVWVAADHEAAVLMPAPETVIRHVHIAPAIDRVAAPRPDAVSSDRDRRSATRDRAPRAENNLPRSVGATSERVEGANGARPVEPAIPSIAAGAPAAPMVPPVLSQISPSGLAAPPPVEAPTDLGRALRNLKGFFDSQNFDNPQGGQTDQSADIQFDSKGADFGPWLRRFRAQVYRNWFIPQAAFTHSGRVVLQFNVHRNGRITDVAVVQPSSVGAFNSAAYAAILRSSPTMVLPADYPTDVVFFTVTFYYRHR